MGNKNTELRKYKRRHGHRQKLLQHNECKFDENDICIICGKQRWNRESYKKDNGGKK